MKAVVFENSNFFYKDVDDSDPIPGWIKIKVEAAGLCGSDMQRLLYSTDPVIPGHEFSGIVYGKGDGFSHGDPVSVKPLIACSSCAPCDNGNYQFCVDGVSLGKELPGGFAEYVNVPSVNVRKTNDIDFESAAMADIAAVAVHVYNKSERPTGLDVVIIGDGAVALSCAQLFRTNNVDLFGKHSKNIEIARSFGVDAYDLESLVKLPDENYDIVIEAVGRRQDKTINEAIRLVRKNGKITVAGAFPNKYSGEVDFRKLFYKEALLVGANSYGKHNGNDEFDIGLSAIERGEINYASIITDILPLRDFAEGINRVQNRNKSGTIKVVYKP